jgi:hypothetical protein
MVIVVLVSVVAEEDTCYNNDVIAYDDIETFIKVYAYNGDFLNRGQEDFDELMNIKKELEQNGQYSNDWNFRTYFYAREIPDGTFKNGENIFEQSGAIKPQYMETVEDEWQEIQQKYSQNSNSTTPTTQQTSIVKTFVPITEQEFAMRFLAVCMEDVKNGSNAKKKIAEIFKQKQNYVETLYEYFENSTPLYSDGFEQFFDDLNVNFDFENHHCNAPGSKILGFHTLDNGFTFLGIEAAGDWEIAVTCIMYWDGNDFRGYVPKDGNSWNYLNNKAFWNDAELDGKYLEQYQPQIAQEIQERDGQQKPPFIFYNLVDEDKMLEEIKKIFP